VSGIEYRVSWKRDGLRRKSRTFIRRATAERHAEMLRNGDPHWRCDEGHGYYAGSGYAHDRTTENEWVPTCMPDIVEGPTVEVRTVSEWAAA